MIPIGDPNGDGYTWNKNSPVKHKNQKKFFFEFCLTLSILERI